MNVNAAFTIVAKNYIGLAQILEKSFKRFNPGIDFYIIVADEFDDILMKNNLPSNVLIAKEFLNYPNEKWEEMTFKYNLTEFCTAIKPGSFKYLFAKGYRMVCYFDPDIFIFSSISEIINSLQTKECIITPQVVGVHKIYEGEHPEWHMNVNGIYNLGFIGLVKSEKTMDVLDWWENRLYDHCFSDRVVGEFTDQKWMDWAPAFWGDSIRVSRNLGMNLAPWNFFERQIHKNSNNEFIVSFRGNDITEKRNDKLIFIHFSGFDYKSLKKGKVIHKRMDLNTYPDLREALEIYGNSIKNNADIFDSFIDQEYSYATYDNNDPITDFHRHIYNGLIKSGSLSIHPFLTGDGTFYQELRSNGLMSSNPPIKTHRRAVYNIEGKRKILDKLFFGLYKIMRRDKYILFVKSLHDYCRPEFHTFLLNKKKIIK